MGDDSKKVDLTRLEDLSHYLHEEDPETESKLSISKKLPKVPGTKTKIVLPIPIEEEKTEAEFEVAENDLTDSFADEPTQPEIENPFLTEGFTEAPHVEEEAVSDPVIEQTLEVTNEVPESALFDFQNSEPISDNNTTQQEQEAEIESESLSESPFEATVAFREVELPPPSIQKLYQQEEPQERTPPENFDDLKAFGNSIQYGSVERGGNPPFSLIIGEIRNEECASEIRAILKEHNLLNDNSEKDIEIGIRNGAILISQISEYSAIYLYHRFKNLDVKLIFGLSDDVHPSKHFEQTRRGSVRKQNIRQNKKEYQLLNEKITPDDVVITTQQSVAGYLIKETVTLLSVHSAINALDLTLHSSQEDESQMRAFDDDRLEEKKRTLLQDLRSKALEVNANAVVGVTITLLPITTKGFVEEENFYEIIISGTGVYITADRV